MKLQFVPPLLPPRARPQKFVPGALSPCVPRVARARRATRRRTKWYAPRSCVESTTPSWKVGPIDYDFQKDVELQVLEQELDAALEVEDFRHASDVRDALYKLQTTSYVAVLSANLKFYAAFAAGSIVDMAGCWLQDGGVTCKHPLGPLAEGYVNVINSFGYLFSLGLPEVKARNVAICMRGAVAWVTCEEHAEAAEEGEQAEEAAKKNESFGKERAAVVMAATNIFAKRNGQWYLCHHSAHAIYKEDRPGRGLV